MTEQHDESRFPRSVREAWPEPNDWYEGPYQPAHFSMPILIMFAVALGLFLGCVLWWLAWT